MLEATEYQALIGLTVGAVFPLLPSDWLEIDHRPGNRRAGLVLWAVLMVAVPAATFVLTGSRGAVGFVVGLGLAGLLTSLRGGRSLLPVGLGVGAVGVLVTGYPWLRALTMLSRDERSASRAIAVGMAVVGFALMALTPRPTVREEAV